MEELGTRTESDVPTESSAFKRTRITKAELDTQANIYKEALLDFADDLRIGIGRRANLTGFPVRNVMVSKNRDTGKVTTVKSHNFWLHDLPREGLDYESARVLGVDTTGNVRDEIYGDVDQTTVLVRPAEWSGQDNYQEVLLTSITSFDWVDPPIDELPNPQMPPITS